MNSKFYAQAEVLVEVARLGSMTAAAETLRLSKSNVSHKIAEMESDLDVVLLKRNTRTLELTPAGHRVYDLCVQAVDALQIARVEVGHVHQSAAPEGVVSVSGSNLYLSEFIMPSLPSLRDRLPLVRIDLVSGEGDTSLSRDNKNKTIFSGLIDITASSNVFQTSWAELIKAAKATLPCWNIDTQVIWDRFLAFNRSRGNGRVPAGFLLGFMRRWRNSQGTPPRPEVKPTQKRVANPKERELLRQIQAAPTANRQFHASDLCRLIGHAAYEARVLDVIRKFGCQRFSATLAVHGRAVLAGEISR